MTHHDCGAYGGLAAFKNDFDFEKKQHLEQQKKMKGFLKSALPNTKIITVFAGKDGLYIDED